MPRRQNKRLAKRIRNHKPSIALSFPIEIIETILLQIRVPALVILAAHLPLSWGKVIETSPKIRSYITYYEIPMKKFWHHSADYENAGDYPRCRRKVGDKGYLFFRQRVEGGMLLVHQHVKKKSKEGFIFVPTPVPLEGRHASPLKILDPATKVVDYIDHIHPTHFGHEFIELRDLDGAVVCHGPVKKDVGGSLEKYVRASCGIERLSDRGRGRRAWKEDEAREKARDSEEEAYPPQSELEGPFEA